MDDRDQAAEIARVRLDDCVGRGKVPGVQYVVVSAERTAFSYEAGWLDLGTGRRMQASTTLMAYSMSKTITAAAVMQLVDAGKVALDDKIGRYLEKQPYGSDVTVRHLLTHTSGIPNPIPLRWVHPATAHASFDESVALDAVLQRHPRLSWPPGTRYRYSNIGYWLLAGIVERASGEAFISFVRGHTLLPLGIGDREVAYTTADPNDHACGYLEKYSIMNALKRLVVDRELIGEYQGRWLQIRDHYPNGAAFGGLVGTAQGFGKFLQDQLRPQSMLFGAGATNAFYTPATTRNGAAIPMTPGWHVGRLGGARFFYYKEGGGGGFHCMMRLYPHARIGTVVMTNATGFDVARLLNEIDPPFMTSTAGTVPA